MVTEDNASYPWLALTALCACKPVSTQTCWHILLGQDSRLNEQRRKAVRETTQKTASAMSSLPRTHSFYVDARMRPRVFARGWGKAALTLSRGCRPCLRRKEQREAAASENKFIHVRGTNDVGLPLRQDSDSTDI